jgi:hypothetical protein
VISIPEVRISFALIFALRGFCRKTFDVLVVQLENLGATLCYILN